MTALAPVTARWLRYFGLDRKAIAPSPALSSGATRSITTSPSPASSEPQRAASSRREIPTACGEPMGVRAAPPNQARLLVGERLDHLVGDVDPRARKHDRILQYQVEFFQLGNLLDDLVRPLLHGGE